MAGAWGRFVALSGKARRLFVEALFFVFLSKVLVTLLPFKTIAKIFGGSGGDGRFHATDAFLDEIRRSLKRTNRIAFWKNRCLVSSLAGRFMLRRRKISCRLYLGAGFDDRGRLKAHAWLNSGDFEVVERGDGYTELFSFS